MWVMPHEHMSSDLFDQLIYLEDMMHTRWGGEKLQIASGLNAGASTRPIDGPQPLAPMAPTSKLYGELYRRGVACTLVGLDKPKVVQIVPRPRAPPSFDTNESATRWWRKQWKSSAAPPSSACTTRRGTEYIWQGLRLRALRLPWYCNRESLTVFQ